MPGRANFSAQALANPELISGRNAAVKEAHRIGIATSGLRELQRSLKRLEPETQKLLVGDLKTAAQPVLAEARASAPHQSGRLATALRISATLKGVALQDRVPYANVIHWGGSTGRGHKPGVAWSGSVLIRPSLFISHAIERHETEIVNAVADAVEQAAVRTGWTA